MELDDLKYLFKEQDVKKTPEELALFFKTRSRSIIEKINRSLLKETYFAAVFVIIGTVAFFVLTSTFYKAMSLLIIVFCGSFLFYMAGLKKRIRFYQQSMAPVKENLRAIVRIVEIFIKLYFWLTMLMLPIVFLLGFMTITPLSTFSPRAMSFYLVWFVGWSVLMYFFTKWFLNKMYGKYLAQLKQQLTELENM
jgi:hypothetical protein